MMELLKKIHSFHLTDRLLSITLLGAEWVLWLLIFLSVISLALWIERGLYFYSSRSRALAWINDLRALGSLQGSKAQDALKLLNQKKGLEAVVVAALVSSSAQSEEEIQGILQVTKLKIRQQLERGLAYLGTLGSNAPFIGLFGTVLGVIKAFHDLSSQKTGPGQEGMQLVMASLGEALIATAVGLLVAIPAVIAFNIFNRRVKKMMTNLESNLQQLLPDVYRLLKTPVDHPNHSTTQKAKGA